MVVVLTLPQDLGKYCTDICFVPQIYRSTDLLLSTLSWVLSTTLDIVSRKDLETSASVQEVILHSIFLPRSRKLLFDVATLIP